MLQDQKFSRLGSRTVIKVDVRILAATNINIPEALANKRLREDLYYRLNAFTLSLPPLRDRKEEIPILLKHFMSRMSEPYARAPLPLSPPLMEAACAFLAGQSARTEQLHQALSGSGRRDAGHRGIAIRRRRQRGPARRLRPRTGSGGACGGRPEVAVAQRQR